MKSRAGPPDRCGPLYRPAGPTLSVGGRWPLQQQMALLRSGGQARTCRALDAGPRPRAHPWTATARIARVGPPASGAAGPTVRPSRNGPRDACAAGSACANGRVAHSVAGIYGDGSPTVRRPRQRRPPPSTARASNLTPSRRSTIIAHARSPSGPTGRGCARAGRGQVPPSAPGRVTSRGHPARRFVRPGVPCVPLRVGSTANRKRASRGPHALLEPSSCS